MFPGARTEHAGRLCRRRAVSLLAYAVTLNKQTSLVPFIGSHVVQAGNVVRTNIYASFLACSQQIISSLERKRFQVFTAIYCSIICLW